MTYAEFLKANGATDEEVKILDVPSARKGFEAMQAKLDAESAARKKAEQEKSDYDSWYNERAVPSYKKMEQEVIQARAERAAALEALKAAQDQGLLEIAEQMDAKNKTSKTDANSGNESQIDLSKYVTAERLEQIADGAGDGLAMMQDLVAENAFLFPGTRLNMRDLRKEATAARKTVYQYWEEKFKVPEARAARERSDKEAYETKLRAEGAEAERARLASQYGNPNTRPLVASRSPLAPRASTGRDKQPWETGENFENSLRNDRVERTTKHVMENLAKPN